METLLFRDPSEADVSGDYLPEDFAGQCKEALGYEPEASVNAMHEEQAIAAVLKDLNMAPLSAAAVAKYQERELWRGAPNRCAVVFASFMATVVAGGLLGWLVSHWLFILCGISAAGIVVTGIVWSELPVRRWERFNLNGYPRVVPRYALQTALEVSAALKTLGVEARWSVEELTTTTDPFLVLDMTNSEYHL